MITIGAEMGAARHFLRVGQVKDTEHLAFLKPTLHINLNHPIISALIKLHKSEPAVAGLVAEQVQCVLHFHYIQVRNAISNFQTDTLKKQAWIQLVINWF